LLTETGIVGFGLKLWFLVVLYRTGLRKITNWTSSVTGSLTLACLLGVSGILVHSFVDFNLQIPANAALFYVLCSLAASPPPATALAQAQALYTKQHGRSLARVRSGLRQDQLSTTKCLKPHAGFRISFPSRTLVPFVFRSF
jgi:hypothetical protein